MIITLGIVDLAGVFILFKQLFALSYVAEDIGLVTISLNICVLNVGKYPLEGHKVKLMTSL